MKTSENAIPSPGQTQTDKGRSIRARRLMITPELMPMFFKTGAKMEVIEGIPEGARFRGYAIDPQLNCLSIFIEHESFDLLYEGYAAPTFKIQMRRIDEIP